MRKYSILMILVLSLVATPATAEEGERFREAVASTGGVVASISDYASAVGIDVLNRGGNAIDAAVAMVFAVGVARPDFGGIGGDGFLVYRGSNNRTAALDFRETAPAAMEATSLSGPGMHQDKDECDNRAGSGHLVIGVPGVVAGMASAIKTYGSGRFTLGQLITNGGDAKRPPYAYELARDGVTVTWELASSLFCNERRLHYYREAERIYGAGAYGTTLRQPEYASSLLFIARNGPDAFYEDARFPDPITGLPRDSIARMIDADMAAAEDNAKTNPTLLANEDRWGGASNDKGLLTVDDFAAYEPVWRTPLTSMYRGHRIIAMPPPTSGGIATIEILNLLEGFPLGSNALDTSLEANARTSWAQSSANHLHALAEAQKLAFADRNKYVADPDFRYDYEGDGVPDESVPTKTLTSKDYADHRRGEIDMDSASFDYEPGASGPPHTNHLSVIDGQGNAVAVTTSVGAMFGSAVVAPGTGFVLTSQLEDFNMREPEAANAPGPGKRPRSSQSPTIVVKSGKPVLVVGASGGATIPLGVVQAIVNVAAFGLDVAHAIDAGRIEARFYGDRLGIEAPRFADAVLNELAERGHSLQPYLDLFGEETGYYPLPIAEAVGSNLTTGLNEATSDPRNEYDYADSSGSTFGQGACGQGRACGQ